MGCEDSGWMEQNRWDPVENLQVRIDKSFISLAIIIIIIIIITIIITITVSIKWVYCELGNWVSYLRFSDEFQFSNN